MEWPTFKADASPIEVLIGISRFYGSDPSFVLAGGGNTSLKDDRLLYVKGSGTTLANATPESFVEMDRARLTHVIDRDLGTDVARREALFKDGILGARTHPEKNQRPSVEAALHNVMPAQYVVHTHSLLANMLTCCAKGATLCKEWLGDEALWIPYVTPGYILANTVRKALKEHAGRTGRKFPGVILLQNHGMVICGDTADEVRANTDTIIAKLRTRLGDGVGREPFGPVSRMGADDARGLINVLGPALRGLLAQSDTLKVVCFDDSDRTLTLAGAKDSRQITAGGPVTPDQLVYAYSYPMWFDAQPGEAAEQLVSRLRQAIAAHTKATKFPPLVVLVPKLGMFCVGDDVGAAETVRATYLYAIEVMAGAHRLGGINYMTQEAREFCESWEVETYRRQVAAANVRKGRAASKVAIVTGGAQGFGLEISRELAREGAHVVLADVNAAGAQTAAAQLAASAGAGRTLGLQMNVTDAKSIAAALHQVVRAYGGFDLFVANAGVLKAESVKTQSEKDFDFVTNVNYKGFFLCVQQAAPMLAIQRQARPEYWSDIVQINSKSGLEGSNKNFAYAGSKFGGIGLTQSFALELVADGIKVNAICPGNFFDGPLWSDPNTGLFVQYLRAGKVPGAKTIAEVRRAYEARVPMGRGCTGPDVMKAIFYIMEQQYETGQAIPVTGGQVMLR